MAGAIAIVILLLLLPVGDLRGRRPSASARVRQAADGRRRGAPRGQRADRSESLTRRRAPTHDASDIGTRLTQAVVRYAVERMRLDPPPLDHPRTEAELRALAGQHDHRPRASAARGACGCSPTCWRRPAFRSTTRASSRSSRRRPPRRRSLFDLVRRGGQHVRRVVARRRPARCSPRTRRCGGWPTWPGCPAEAGGVFVSGGRPATLARWWRPATRWREGHPDRRATSAR